MSANVLSMTEIQMLDKEIAQLGECKPLNETEVKQLCDKVKILIY
jgi:hypothetical protein